MRFAQKDGKRILPNPLIKDAVCPLCKSSVIGKCGEIKVWHWSHKAVEDCDSFSEGETEWHLNWKKKFPEEYQEVIVGEHRADVKIKDIVVEFQNSIISKEDIEERESYYGKMKWVLNGNTICKNLDLKEKLDYWVINWKWLPKSWLYSKRPIYIDLNFLHEKYKEKYLAISKKDDDDEFEETSRYTYWEEYADGNTYPKTGYDVVYKKYGPEKGRLWNLMECFRDKLLLIKGLHLNGKGWGKLGSKQNFIKECEYGYYRD